MYNAAITKGLIGSCEKFELEHEKLVGAVDHTTIPVDQTVNMLRIIGSDLAIRIFKEFPQPEKLKAISEEVVDNFASMVSTASSPHSPFNTHDFLEVTMLRYGIATGIIYGFTTELVHEIEKAD